MQTWLFGQALPQVPQLFLFVLRLVSQPFVSLSPSQSAKPSSQVPVQTPAVQVRVVMWLPLQRALQAPQLFGLVLRSTHTPSQRVLGEAQPQVPLTQTW